MIGSTMIVAEISKEPGEEMYWLSVIDGTEELTAYPIARKEVLRLYRSIKKEMGLNE